MKRFPVRWLSLGLAMAGLVAGCAGTSNPNLPPPNGKGVYFVEPANGATVSSPFVVKFGVVGMGIRPAGELVSGTGHHHLLVNTGSISGGQVIPADDAHMHFGKGQTEAELKLPPGTYKLTMQFADGYHQSYGKEMRAAITVTVK